MLMDLWSECESRLPEELRGQQGEIYAGPLNSSDGSAWAQNHREQGPDAVNLTIEMNGEHISVNAVGGTKGQAAFLEAWLARVGFTSLRIDHERELDSNSEHLAYHVRRKWGRDSVVGSPEPWLSDLARGVATLIPVAREANAFPAA